ncbi:unnamed protein product [Cuscuta campestris]|uniref:DUF4283 domain-containing protein n=1 Tax=Cuscuta campestris TaxID=132261 RepID=A0A484LMW7_9ASTE|nr:unnamed protein product [Cuscuta campestris]
MVAGVRRWSAVIGKFRRRPPLLVVKNFLTRLGFSGGFTVGELFTNSFLINFEQDEDYQRFFYYKVWTIGKDTMSVTKWSPTLTQEEDSPIVLVWISIPNLPIHLHHQSALFSIASMLGNPLKMDNDTLYFSRPKLARVCVEVDVSKTLHQRIHVKHNDTDLFFQVIYEEPPLFCSSCRKLGHNQLSCKPVKLPAKRDILLQTKRKNSTQKTSLIVQKNQENNDVVTQEGWTKVTQKGKAPIAPKQGNASKPVSLVWALNPLQERYMGNFQNGYFETGSKIPYYGGMKCLFHKLSHLKSKIASWNKEQFGNIFDLLKEAEEEASAAEINYEREPTEANREIVNLKKAQLLQVGNLEHSYWKQKCNLKWLKEGDANTKFFHNLVKDRRRQQKITGLNDDQGKFQEDPTILENMVTSYYHKLFNYEEPAPSSQDYDAFLSNIPKILDQHHNQELLHLPSEDEVKATLFDMEANSCAGPDGFNVNFFKECREIVHREVTSACQEVFLGIPLHVAAASTNICLIPKCENASRLNDFRPVCLSTVASKIATKCIARRLSKVLPLIISEEQGAFVAAAAAPVDEGRQSPTLVMVPSSSNFFNFIIFFNKLDLKDEMASRMFNAGVNEGQSTTRPPLFDGTNYSYWKEMIRMFIQSNDYKLWLIVKNGCGVPMKKVGEVNVPTTEEESNNEDCKKMELNAKAINMIYCGVNTDDYRKISRCETEKQMWEKLEVTYEGTVQLREAKIDQLTHEYELFSMKENEKIEDMFERFSNIIMLGYGPNARGGEVNSI